MKKLLFFVLSLASLISNSSYGASKLEQIGYCGIVFGFFFDASTNCSKTGKCGLTTEYYRSQANMLEIKSFENSAQGFKEMGSGDAYINYLKSNMKMFKKMEKSFYAMNPQEKVDVLNKCIEFTPAIKTN